MSQKKNIHDEIAKVAYEIFENSGRMYGCELEHWLAAEEIVMERHAREIEQQTAIIGSGKRKAPGKTESKKLKTSGKTPRSGSGTRTRKSPPKKKTE